MDGKQNNPTRGGVAWDVKIRLVLIFLASVLAGGITPGMNLFIPLFAESGFLAEACGGQTPPCKDQTLLISNLFLMCGAVSTAGFLPAGLLFDMVGGRACGVLGAILVGAGSFVLAFSISSSSSFLLVVSIMLMDLSSLINAYAFNALMWHMPDSMGILFGIGGGSAQTAALLPVTFQWAIHNFGLSLYSCLMIYGCLSMFAACLLFVVVPSQKEFFARAHFVLGIPVTAPEHTFKSVKDSFRMGWRVLSYVKREVVPFWCAQGAISGVSMPYMMTLVAFGTALFGDKNEANSLAVFQSQLTVLFSIVGGIGSGTIIDWASLGTMAGVLCGCVVTVLILSPTASWYAQLVCTCVITFLNVAIMSMGLRFVAFFCPSHRFGMVSGLFSGASMVFALTGSMFWSILSALLSGVNAYTVPTFMCGIVGLLAWAVLASKWSSLPMPTTVLLEGDEEELMNDNFGLKTFEDAEEVLQISRKEILRLLASQDMSERRILIEKMKDEDVQVRWALRAYRQGYEIPDMDTTSYMMLVAADLERSLTDFFSCGVAAPAKTPRGDRSARY